MKILLVDDNKYILSSLEQGIDYEKLGFEKPYMCRSLESAIEILSKEQIQAVVTDIEMPNGTGLELVEWINENRPDIVTVFCTSYADFSYAKRAIELHCFDYYLKPIQYDKLYQILEGVVHEINRRKEEKERKKLESCWLKNRDENRYYFWLEVLEIDYGYAEDEWEELAQSRQIDYTNETSVTLGILKVQVDKERINKMRYGDKKFVLENILRELLLREQMQVEALFKNENEAWRIVISENRKMTDHEFEEVMRSILEEMMHALNGKIGFLYSRDVLLEDCRSCYLELEQAYHSREKKGIDLFDCVEFESDDASVLVEGNERALAELKQFLDMHYNEKVTEEQITEEIHYNMAYISKLFKKRYGMTIGNYVLHQRIEHAKDLLLKDKMSVSDIALEVGYDNFSYFSRLFKKRTGYAPKDYRKEIKNIK